MYWLLNERKLGKMIHSVLDMAGGVLRTSAPRTLNRQTESRRRHEHTFTLNVSLVASV